MNICGKQFTIVDCGVLRSFVGGGLRYANGATPTDIAHIIND